MATSRSKVVLTLTVAISMMLISCTTATYIPDTTNNNRGVSQARDIVRHTLVSLPGCLGISGGAFTDIHPTAVHITSTSLSVDYSNYPSRGPYLLKDINPRVVFLTVPLGDSVTAVTVSDEQGRFAANNPLDICYIHGDVTQDHALRQLVDALMVLKQAALDPALNKDDDAHFAAVVSTYRAKATKPQLPEDARRFKVQAEAAIRDKEYANAADYFGQALDVAPWWPEGHFNRALMLEETDDYEGAIAEMKRYLLLVPDASDARASQDKIYEWERKAGTSN